MENISVQEKVENKIIDYINQNSAGRLIIFKPEKSGKNPDLIIKAKGEYGFAEALEAKKMFVRPKIFGTLKKKNPREVWLYVNSYDKTNDETIFKKEIDMALIEKNKNPYFAFAFFNSLKQKTDEDVCLLSMSQFEKTAKKIGEDKYVFESFLLPQKKDKFSEFIVNKKDFSKFFLHIIYDALS